ncbi:hypothetical protein K2173_007580 [Erythroxylum novogranatense]|uniref:DUF4408 domain-containing protein n=1 Tax=Erythroxylum novogranatense TaxID=1862640 RepID=A0AAV8S978_9ROSI|nr:hypothetical protein K2173_007580 [Erythroxylum novogranatense]
MKCQDHQSSNQTSNLHCPKLAIKFLASILLFSFMFLCSSPLPTVSNLIQLFACNVSKNYMFLLCNGILVLIVKNAGFFSYYQQEAIFSGEDTVKIGMSCEKVVESSVNKAGVAEEVKELQATEKNSLLVVGQEHNSSVTNVAEVDEQGNRVIVLQDDEEEATGLPSAEELNRKCDDFIRRIKEGIKLEAQQKNLPLM